MVCFCLQTLAKYNKCTAYPLGLDATSSFTVTAIAGLLIFTTAIGIAGILVGIVERVVSGNCQCLVACYQRMSGRAAGASAGPAEEEPEGLTGQSNQAKLVHAENGNGSAKNLASKEAVKGMTAEERLQNNRMSKILEVCM